MEPLRVSTAPECERLFKAVSLLFDAQYSLKCEASGDERVLALASGAAELYERAITLWREKFGIKQAA